MIHLILIVICLTLGSCSSQQLSARKVNHENNVALEELRIEVADVKHALHSTQVELRILEEKVKNNQTSKTAAKESNQSNLALQLANLEKKFLHLEKIQDKFTSDLRQISVHANQSATAFSQYKDKLRELEQDIAAQNKRLDEVVKLKSTLTSISKAIKEKNEDASDSFRKYRVKPGDSLERIARSQNTSVEAIKRINQLDSDRIVVGQEIKIP